MKKYYSEKKMLIACEVAEMLNVADSTARKYIARLNHELKADGYVTIAGRVSKQYIIKRMCL